MGSNGSVALCADDVDDINHVLMYNKVLLSNSSLRKELLAAHHHFQIQNLS